MKKSYTYKKLHPKITGKCTVVSRVGSIINNYYVDLDEGTCTCTHGYPSIHTVEKGDIPNPYCSHKLKAIYALYAREKDQKTKDELYYAFLRALSTRYNIYEVCSAFHKELRRGDLNNAWYWAQILITMRGMSGIIRYMVNITYEETRNHLLAKALLDCFEHPKEITIKDCFKFISWFCDSKKKWDLGRWRYHHFFFHEMLGGYFRLINDFGQDVAKSDNIIPTDTTFFPKLIEAFKKENHADIQYYLKGLQKMQHTKWGGLQKLRGLIFKCLSEIKEKSTLKDYYGVDNIFKMIEHKGEFYQLCYHDINMLCDLLEGEDLTYGNSECPPLGDMPRISPNLLKTIPLYAQDSHTWCGRYRLKKYAGQLVPQVPQTDIDYCWSGIYLGLAFRYLSMAQLKRVGKWHEVSFTVKKDGKPVNINFFEYLYKLLY